jgi:hypothetical protein
MDNSASDQVLLRVAAGHLVKPEKPMEKVLAYLPTQIITGIYGRISLGGHLHVTRDELYHHPHAFNLENPENFVRIPIQNIKSLDSKQRGLAALLNVHTTSGETVQFVCWSRKKVMNTVAELQGKPQAF